LDQDVNRRQARGSEEVGLGRETGTIGQEADLRLLRDQIQAWSATEGESVMMPEKAYDFLIRPATVPADQSGILISITPEEAGWDTLGFSVRRLAKGEVWHENTGDQEAAIVLLGGRVTIDWGEGSRSIGRREHVFSGYPFCVYLPCGTSFELHAETLAEFTESRVRSRLKGQPHLFTPSDLGCEIRGSGDTTRQIVSIIRPEFAADKLMMNEVYTPGGNWSSFPPHRHEINNPPGEADLDELYYFRIDRPDSFAFLRVYDSAGTRDLTVTIRDGDLALLREGYHLVAVPPGCGVYYQAVLAGAVRSLAASIDPRYAQMRDAAPDPDPRIPMISRE
jgi:5-deoxy-glucuronate isomerase